MTLYTTDYLEYYLTLVGWIVNNGIWSIFVASGVFALPFVAIIGPEWLRARAEGADEGRDTPAAGGGLLRRRRVEEVLQSSVLVVHAAIPLSPVPRREGLR